MNKLQFMFMMFMLLQGAAVLLAIGEGACDWFGRMSRTLGRASNWSIVASLACAAYIVCVLVWRALG